MEPRPIAFKEWRDTRTFSNLKSTHCVDIHLKSTCDVNLLSKPSIIFKEWRVIVLFVLLRSHKGQTI
jgi:hypothetical protein